MTGVAERPQPEPSTDWLAQVGAAAMADVLGHDVVVQKGSALDAAALAMQDALEKQADGSRRDRKGLNLRVEALRCAARVHSGTAAPPMVVEMYADHLLAWLEDRP